MRQTSPTDRWVTAAAAAIAVLAGGVVLILLFPAVVLTSYQPQCVSTFGYRVPCGLGGYVHSPSIAWLTWPALSFAAGLATAVLVGTKVRRMAAAVASRRCPVA